MLVLIISFIVLRVEKEFKKPDVRRLQVISTTFIRNRNQAIILEERYQYFQRSTNAIVHSEYVTKDAEINNTNFIGCTAFGILFNEATGAALFAAGSKIAIFNCKLNGNIAKYGGAVCAYDCILNISNSFFDLNKALNYSGALWSMAYEKDGATFPNAETKLYIFQTDFTNNMAKEFFGAVAANYTNPMIENCNFYNNTAVEGGALGVICWYQANLYNVEMINNTCLNNGCPALWIQGRTEIKYTAMNIYCTNVIFINNTNFKDKLCAITYYGLVTLITQGYFCFDGLKDDLIKGYGGAIGENKDNVYFYNISSVKECRYLVPTQIFTQSIEFTQSNEFTPSQKFSSSKSFTKTSDFTKSSEFSYSNSFSLTNQFTESNLFSCSLSFEIPTPTLSPTTEETTQQTTNKETPTSSQTQSSSPSENQEKKEKKHSPLNAGLGGLGGLLLLIVLVIIIYCLCRNKNKKSGCCGCKKKEKVEVSLDIELKEEPQPLYIPRDADWDSKFVIWPNPTYGQPINDDTMDEERVNHEYLSSRLNNQYNV